jgi:hypothetical protein
MDLDRLRIAAAGLSGLINELAKRAPHLGQRRVRKNRTQGDDVGGEPIHLLRIALGIRKVGLDAGDADVDLIEIVVRPASDNRLSTPERLTDVNATGLLDHRRQSGLDPEFPHLGQAVAS